MMPELDPEDPRGMRRVWALCIGLSIRKVSGYFRSEHNEGRDVDATSWAHMENSSVGTAIRGRGRRSNCARNFSQADRAGIHS